MSFSLIYICCSFRGGILSVVFPAVAICFWPAGNLECPCLFSDLILFPFLLLFFYIVPYPSFSSVFFIDLYLLQFPGRHSICCFRHCSHMFLTRREPGVPLSLFRPYPLPFSPPFLLYCSLPFLFFYVYVFFIDLYLLLFPGRHSICRFPHCSHMFLTRRDLECPCLFSDLILFPFLLLFFYIVPYPSFSSMSFSLIYICCSFRGGILSVVFFPHCSHMFLTRREPGVPLSLFRPYPLPFSPPFLLYCSLPFLFFYVFFIDLYLL